MSFIQKNVDSTEIHKFNAQAQEWWDTHGSMKALHAINPLRLQFIQQYTPLSQKHVLDIGCGGGILTESLAKAGAITTGIDLAENSITAAQQHAREAKLNITYQCITAEEIAKTHAESFDIVTCMELLEHVPDPSSIIQACSKLLKPEGHAFFSTINRNSKSFLFGILGAEYLLKLIPKGTHHYAKFIRPFELDQWARQANLKCQNMTGIHYNPFNKKFSLKDNIDVNYLVHYQKIKN